jgi:ABC-2 type transport system ATP-binding protein
MTTHILEVAERMADRIGVMCDGRLVAEGTLEDLRRQAGAGHGTLEDTFLVLTDTSSGQLGSGRGPIAA